MGVLNKTKIYLAGNLQEIDRNEALNWREDFEAKVKPLGIVCLNPLKKVLKNFEVEDFGFTYWMKKLVRQGEFEEVHQKMKSIRRRDLGMIDFSQAVVANIDTTKFTAGTIEELSLAQRSNKKVFIVVSPDKSHIPLWILGMFEPQTFFNSLDEVVDELKKYNSGEKPIEQENWRIFEDNYV